MFFTEFRYPLKDVTILKLADKLKINRCTWKTLRMSDGKALSRKIRWELSLRVCMHFWTNVVVNFHGWSLLLNYNSMDRNVRFSLFIFWFRCFLVCLIMFFCGLMNELSKYYLWKFGHFWMDDVEFLLFITYICKNILLQYI